MLKHQTSLNNFASPQNKCGEIFYQNYNDFTIFCTFCQMKSFHFNDYLQHVRNVHLKNYIHQQGNLENEAELCEAEVILEDYSENDYFQENDEIEAELCETEEDILEVCMENDYLQDNLENQSELCKTEDILGTSMEQSLYSELNVESCSEVEKLMKVRKKYNSESQDVNNELSDESEFQQYQYLNNSELDVEICSEENKLKPREKRHLKGRKRSNSENQEANNDPITDELEFLLKSSYRQCEESKYEKSNKQLEFNCPECQKRFLLKKSMDRHVFEIHKGYKCSLCDTRFRHRFHLRRHELKHNPERKFRCHIEECSKVYNDPENLKRHELTHNPDQYFPCPVAECKKIYINFRNFEKHQITQHKYTQTYVNKFVCDICGYSCRAETTLIIHQRGHTGEKPFLCDFCEKRFVSKSALKAHIVKHSGTRPHVCQICQATFVYQRILQRHMLIHSDEKRFKCKICDKAFKQPQCLDGHMRRLHMEPKARMNKNKGQ